jgi:hypothetical protein
MSDLKDNRERIREEYRIPDAWRDLGLPGEPALSCKSPWRDERNPSFSIYDDGRKFKDHATGEQGDVFEFVKLSLDSGFKEAVRWIEERKGIVPSITQPTRARRKASPQPKPPLKKIEWPGEVVMGTEATWRGFAKARGLTFPAVHAAARAGILRFTRAEGHKCFVITDGIKRAAEIRRIDGKEFRHGKKPLALKGVDKQWLPGATLFGGTNQHVGVFIAEGATDYLAAFNAYVSYKKNGGKRSWIPLALLGAGCKSIHPEIVERLPNRLVRLAPDGDTPGDKMRDTWGELLHHLGCQVEILEMPRGRDLRDMLESGELKPEEVFA